MVELSPGARLVWVDSSRNSDLIATVPHYRGLLRRAEGDAARYPLSNSPFEEGLSCRNTRDMLLGWGLFGRKEPTVTGRVSARSTRCRFRLAGFAQYRPHLLCREGSPNDPLWLDAWLSSHQIAHRRRKE